MSVAVVDHGDMSLDAGMNRNKTRKEILLDARSIETVFLNPGEIHVTDRPAIVHTVLGSCVSVVFHSRSPLFSSICHAQMPDRGDGGKQCFEDCPVRCLRGVDDSCDFKFVTCCVRYMLDMASRWSVPMHRISVKVFGGANVINYTTPEKTVGVKNTDAAFDMLRRYNLSVHSKSIGGIEGMVLYLYSHTGVVYVSRITKTLCDASLQGIAGEEEERRLFSPM
ncbi:MAG: chemotaxis protein CheD [Spirochaetes bacterium]|nr:chemotaxis protein CheD [Spirochaetota bacterium]